MDCRTFSVTVINLLGLIAFNDTARAQASQGPVGIIAIGHFGLTGEGADPDQVGREAKEYSWATGEEPVVNSVYQRLVAVQPATKGPVANTAAGGARANVFTSQAMAALEVVPAPELVIVQTMDNDLNCDGEVEANVRAFGTQVAEALGTITEASPDSKILVVSQRGRPATYTAMMADIPVLTCSLLARGGAPSSTSTGPFLRTESPP